MIVLGDAVETVIPSAGDRTMMMTETLTKSECSVKSTLHPPKRLHLRRPDLQMLPRQTQPTRQLTQSVLNTRDRSDKLSSMRKVSEPAQTQSPRDECAGRERLEGEFSRDESTPEESTRADSATADSHLSLQPGPISLRNQSIPSWEWTSSSAGAKNASRGEGRSPNHHLPTQSDWNITSLQSQRLTTLSRPSRSCIRSGYSLTLPSKKDLRRHFTVDRQSFGPDRKLSSIDRDGTLRSVTVDNAATSTVHHLPTLQLSNTYGSGPSVTDVLNAASRRVSRTWALMSPRTRETMIEAEQERLDAASATLAARSRSAEALRLKKFCSADRLAYEATRVDFLPKSNCSCYYALCELNDSTIFVHGGQTEAADALFVDSATNACFTWTGVSEEDHEQCSVRCTFHACPWMAV